MVHQDERRSPHIVEDLANRFIRVAAKQPRGRRKRRHYHRLGQSTYELDLPRGPSRRLSAAHFSNPNLIKRANTSLVASMSFTHVTTEVFGSCRVQQTTN